MPWKHPSRWAGILLVLAALVLYLLTLDNGLRPGELEGGDLITHQYAQVQARPSNAPGYPLYTLGGWAWFHGLRSLLGQHANPTAILSAYSTLWALLALWLLYQLIVDLTGNWGIGLLLGAFYAVTYFFWYYAVSTEQYASAVAQTLAIVLIAFRWEAIQDRADLEGRTEPAGDGFLLALAFLAGMTLAHLVTVAFVVPPLVWFVLSRRPSLIRRPRLVTGAIGLALLPLVSYAFVYVRGAQHPEWRGAGQWPSTWSWFVDFISTRQGRGELTWSLKPLWTSQYPSLVGQELTWLVLAGGLIGLLLIGRRRGLFLGSTLLLYAAFSFVDRLGNWYQVVMPVYALLVMTFGVTVGWLWQAIDRTLRSRWRPMMLGLLIVGLLALVATRFDRSWPQANQRNRLDDTALAAGQTILADHPEAGAAVLATSLQAQSLSYVTQIWSNRPDVGPVSSDEARRLLASGERPLYVTVDAAPIIWQEVSPDAHLSSAGAALIAVIAQPAKELPAGIQRLDLTAGDGLTLAGYEQISEPTGVDGKPWPVRLIWRADGAIAHDWNISVRPTLAGKFLSRPEGGIILVDRVNPVHGAYPTSRWQPGEVVGDDYFLPLRPGQKADGLQVVIYRQLPNGAFQNLAVFDVLLR